MTSSLITSRRNWLSSPTSLSIVSAALLLLLNVASNSYQSCLSVSLPSTAAASPSPAATATATATTSTASWTWTALRIRDWLMEVRLWRVQCRLEVRNSVSDRIWDFLCVRFYLRFRWYIIIAVNVMELMVYWSMIWNAWDRNRNDAYPSHTGWTARYWSSCIIKLNIVNHFCMVTIIGPIQPWVS